ncbi:MAG TPA: hypothetical protein VFF65_13525 [Phycisphaerales bacterium]|nr:hypothetical protein [Phycisphaerales bacterium]
MQITFSCSTCGNQLSAYPHQQGTAVVCPQCQSQQVVPLVPPSPAVMPPAIPAAACDRQTYVLVGILTAVLLGGGFGVHNFIAGRTSTAVTQAVLCAVGLLLIFCTLGLSYLINLAVMVWAIVDVCTVTTDGQGRKMA